MTQSLNDSILLNYLSNFRPNPPRSTMPMAEFQRGELSKWVVVSPVHHNQGNLYAPGSCVRRSNAEPRPRLFPPASLILPRSHLRFPGVPEKRTSRKRFPKQRIQ